MSGFLLDTNTVSEMVSLKPNSGVLEWFGTVDEQQLFLSVMTLGEIRRGVAALPQSRKRNRLESWLEVDLQIRFAGRILPIDNSVADRWGRIVAEAKMNGATLPVVDALIAATALENQLTVVTRNVKDFEVVGLHVANPWNG